MFFLAWLLAFLIDPVVSRMVTRLPFLPRGVAASLVFVITVVLAIALLAAIASSVIDSLKAIIGTAPTIDDAVGKLLAPIQTQIDEVGLQINLSHAASDLVNQLSSNASALLASAVSSGLQLFSEGTAIIFIAVVFVANKARFLIFAHRLVPVDQRPLSDEFVAATSRSFGGFVRGQFSLAALYGLIAGGARLHLRRAVSGPHRGRHDGAPERALLRPAGVLDPARADHGGLPAARPSCR